MMGKVTKVQLTTRKHPRSFAGNAYAESRRIDLAHLKKEMVLYSGSAQEAIRYFPQNINVAALLAIAGLGLRNTRVIIIADPAVRNNIHELEIVSSAGSVRTRTQNLLHPDNPKTSYLAVLSAAAMLKQILNPVRTGT
jgi:aspartate dehydrogenase